MSLKLIFADSDWIFSLCNNYLNTFQFLYSTAADLSNWSAGMSVLTDSSIDKEPLQKSTSLSHLKQKTSYHRRFHSHDQTPASLKSLGETRLSKKDLYPPFTLPHPRPVSSCDLPLKRVQVKNTQLGWTWAETDVLSVSQGVSKRTASVFSNSD